MFLFWAWYRFEVSCIGPRPVVPWANTADRESIRGQYRNNQLIIPLLNDSTSVVYMTNIRPAKLVLYGPNHFHMVFEFQTLEIQLKAPNFLCKLMQDLFGFFICESHRLTVNNSLVRRHVCNNYVMKNCRMRT